MIKNRRQIEQPLKWGVTVIILSVLVGFRCSAVIWRGGAQKESNGNVTNVTPAQSPSRLEYTELVDRKIWLIADGQYLLRTSDGGRTWAYSYPDGRPLKQEEEIQGLSFVDENNGFLIVNRQLLATTDGGASWQQVCLLEFDSLQCQFLDTRRGWAVGSITVEGWPHKPGIPAYVGVVFATNDGGKSWQRQSLNLPKGYFDATKWTLRALFFLDASKGWIAGDDVIFSTDAGGTTWQLRDVPPMDYSRIRFLDSQFGWATERQGARIVVSSDGGRNWERLRGPPGFGSYPAHVLFLTPKHGFATVLGLYETSDGGKTWHWRTGGNRAQDRAYDYLGIARDGTLVAIGINDEKGTALLSTDRGQTWELASK